MKQILVTFVFILALMVCSAPANDGVFYSSGNTLVPLQETQVQLKKEVLKFFVRDYAYMDVEVDFEFYNPGKAKKVTVGFLTPPADGDVTEDEQEHPMISDFTVLVNDRAVPFQIKKLKDTSFKFGETEIRGDDFVYYFPVRFQKGVTKIRHTYRFRGGASVELQRDFDYQITTGKRWANKQIDDFRLEIHLDNGVYFIPASFLAGGKLAAWQIIGDGVIDENPREWFGEDAPKIRMAHLNHGYFLLEEKNFRPDNDIFIGEYNWAAGWVDRWCNYAQECIEPDALEKIVGYFNLDPYEGIEEPDLAELSDKELKYVRNYFYAVRGFDFQDKELRDFYSQFFWYKPDKTLKAEDVKLSAAEKVFLDKIRIVESKRKN